MIVAGVDLSTKTGVVVLEESGTVLFQEELRAKSRDTPGMVDLIQRILMAILSADLVCIEGFAYGARGDAVDWQYGLGHILRCELHRRNQEFRIVSPSALKKFAGTRGNAGKVQVAMEVYKQYGLTFDSDNITDAFVLAHYAIAELDTIRGKKG